MIEAVVEQEEGPYILQFLQDKFSARHQCSPHVASLQSEMLDDMIQKNEYLVLRFFDENTKEQYGLVILHEEDNRVVWLSGTSEMWPEVVAEFCDWAATYLSGDEVWGIVPNDYLRTLYANVAGVTVGADGSPLKVTFSG